MNKDILIGFEFEFTSSFTKSQLREKLKKELNLKFSGRRFEKWQLSHDGSLYSKLKTHNPIELVSPPQLSSLAFKTLKSIFNWMSENNCKTNHTTGLHVNISFCDSDFNENIDPLKLIMLLPEKNMLLQFKRQRNIYCKSYIKDFNSWSKRFKHEDVNHWLDAATVLKRMLKSRREKFRIVNLNHLYSKNKYVEFRSIGNNDYHKRFNEIRKNINQMVSTVKLSAHPSKKQVFYKESVLNLME